MLFSKHTPSMDSVRSALVHTASISGAIASIAVVPVGIVGYFVCKAVGAVGGESVRQSTKGVRSVFRKGALAPFIVAFLVESANDGVIGI
jgi:hypothetical protein